MIVESMLAAQKEVNEALREVLNQLTLCDWCDDCATWHLPSEHTKLLVRLRAWWRKIAAQ